MRTRLASALALAAAMIRRVSLCRATPGRSNGRCSAPVRTSSASTSTPRATASRSTGLTAGDFELLEDGKPQTIETLEFIESPDPDAQRGSPRSEFAARAGSSSPRIPQYRVFVLYLDAFHVSLSGSHRASLPMVDFLNRMIGPTRSLRRADAGADGPNRSDARAAHADDRPAVDRPRDWGIADRHEPQPGEIELEAAFPRNPAFAKHLIALRRLDKVYADLEGSWELGDLRDERKNIVVLLGLRCRRRGPTSRSWRSIRPAAPARRRALAWCRRQADAWARATAEARPAAGRCGTRASHLDRLRPALPRLCCAAPRQANVSFYTVRPGGLDPNYSLLSDGISNLRVLADETDGAAVMGSNDLRAGLTKVDQRPVVALRARLLHREHDVERRRPGA